MILFKGEFRKDKVWDAKELPTVEMYDPITDTWTRKADMPTPRNADTCVVDGKIYAIGGTATINNSKEEPWRLKTVEVYDPSTDTWEKAESMNHARAGARSQCYRYRWKDLRHGWNGLSSNSESSRVPTSPVLKCLIQKRINGVT